MKSLFFLDFFLSFKQTIVDLCQQENLIGNEVVLCEWMIRKTLQPYVRDTRELFFIGTSSDTFMKKSMTSKLLTTVGLLVALRKKQERQTRLFSRKLDNLILTFDPISAHLTVAWAVVTSVWFAAFSSSSPNRFVRLLLGLNPRVSVPTIKSELSRQTLPSQLKNVQQFCEGQH